MKYDLDSYLPIRAFSPRNGRGPFSYGMTLEGGGGGGGDIISDIGDALASIDPGPAIGDIGASVDKAVNDVIPGGWVTIGAVALAVIAPYAAPYLAESLPAIEGGSALTGTGAGALEAGYGGASAVGNLAPEVAGSIGTGAGSAAGTGVGLTGAAGTGAGAGIGIGTGGTIGFGGFAAPTALQSALAAAGTGSLYGAGLGGTMSAIKGQDPLKGALSGAFYGGLTGGALSGLESAGVNPYIAKALSSAGTGALRGQDVATLLQNSALSTGLSAIGNQTNQYVNPAITSAGTGAIGSAIKGGDPLTGAISGATGSLFGQGVNLAKNEYNALTAPATNLGSDINPATGLPWSATGSGLAGGAANISLGANVDQPVSGDLAKQYLTAASSDLSSKVADLMPTIDQQRAALLNQADSVKGTYDQYNTTKTALDNYLAGNEFKTAYNDYKTNQSAYQDAISNKYNPAYQNVADLQKSANDLYSQVQTLQSNYDTNKAAYEADSSNTTAFNAANDTANKLNNLIPQYNTAAQEFKTANTSLENLYNSDIAPIRQTLEASSKQVNDLYNTNVQPLQNQLTNLNKALTDQTNQYSQTQDQLTNTTTTASNYVSGLNDIASGKLPTNYLAPELSLTAPTARFADQYYNQFTNTAGMPTAGVTVEQIGSPTMIDAGGGTNTPYVPVTPPSQVESTKAQLDAELADGQITQAEYDAALSNVPTAPANPDQAILDQILADQAANAQGKTDTGTTASGGTTAPTDGTAPTSTSGGTTAPTDGTAVVPTPVSSTQNPDGGTTTVYSDGSVVTSPGPSSTGGESGYSGIGQSGYGESGYSGIGQSGYSGVSGYSGIGTSTGGTGGGTATGGTGGGTATGGTGGGTSTGAGGIAAGIGGALAGAGTSTAAMRAAIKDLTPQLTKATPFKFADEPTFTTQLSNMAPTTPYDYTQQILNAASGGSIADLKAQLTKHTPFSFAQEAKFNTPITQIPQSIPYDYTQQILNAAQGGLIQNFAAGSEVGKVEGVEVLRPQVIHGHRVAPFFQGAQLAPGYQPRQYAEGGTIPEDHNPTFFSTGGLNSLENKYVQGEGDGTSDSVAAMLADGEFVIPADIVSKLGNGSNKAGAGVLDQFLVTIREHAQNHDPKKLPPESKAPLAYLLDAKRKVG